VPDGHSPEPFVGYPRPASADTKRLEALAAGYARMRWITPVVIGSIILADFQLRTAPVGLALTAFLFAANVPLWQLVFEGSSAIE